MISQINSTIMAHAKIVSVKIMNGNMNSVLFCNTPRMKTTQVDSPHRHNAIAHITM